MRILSQSNTAWEGIKDHYNRYRSGTYYLRREFKFFGIDFIKRHRTEDGHGSIRKELSMSVIDQYTLLLRRAGYLKDVKRGVYLKVKKIPKGLTIKQVSKEAYPNSKRWKSEEA